MAEGVFNIARFEIADGVLVLSSVGTTGINASTLGLMLVSTDYTFDPDQDVVGVSGDSTSLPFAEEATGYTRGTLLARTVTEDDAGNRGDIDVADHTFTAVSSSALVIGACIVYNEVATNDSSGRRLVSFHDTGFPVTANGGDITIQWSTGGFLQFTT